MWSRMQRRPGGPVSQAWTFAENQAGSLRDAEVVAISVERGVLVVTCEGDVEDHVLAAGDSLVLKGRGRVVAWALEPASATVRYSAGGARGAPLIHPEG